MTIRRPTAISLPLLLLAVCVARPAGAQPLDRDPADYCIFAQKSLSLKNIAINSACNVGVNCSQPSTNSDCGRADFANPMFAQGSQLASDAVTFNTPGGKVWQLFTNHSFNTSNVTVQSPPVQPFTTPIIAGTCDAACNADPSVLEAFCGFPMPFPACNPAMPITVGGGQTMNLPPGVYGAVTVMTGGTLNLSPGTYDICSFSGAGSVQVTGHGVVINIPDSGSFSLGNDGMFGQQQCGDFIVRIQGAGTFNLGRRTKFSAQVCGPSATLRLGHGGTLLGQFVGSTVASNSDNSMTSCVSSTTTTTTTGTTSTTTHTVPTTTRTSTTTSTTMIIVTTTTTTTSTSTTTTTMAAACTRTPGFFGNHPTVTQGILTNAGGITVCGISFTNTSVNSAHSALEAICVSPQGDQRLQLVRQLLTAALNSSGGCATFADFAACNAVCTNPNATTAEITACGNDADAFNNSGDNVPAPFDTGGAANPGPCKASRSNGCTVLDPASCGP